MSESGPGAALDLLIRLFRPIWFRGKGRLLNSVVQHRGMRPARVFGSQMNLDLSDQVQRNIYLGTFEPHETRILLGHLRQGMTFVDVGANVGYFTALAASRVGAQGKVFSIEPSPKAFSSLQRMIEKNFGSNVRALQLAVGARAGKMDLYVPPEEFGNHTPTLLANPEGKAVPVQVQTLDTLAGELGISVIDVLKIDVEGFEMEAFKGASRLLAQGRIRAVLCEFNDYWLKRAGVSPDILFQFLAESGFRLGRGTPEFHDGCVENYFLVSNKPLPSS